MRDAASDGSDQSTAPGGVTKRSTFHIHKAVAGQNGPVVVNFVPLLPSGIGCVTVDDRRLLSDIKRSPKNFYFNVHTTPDFPNGAIRGQVRHLARN